MPDKFDRFDAYLARKQAQQRRRDHTATPTSVLESAEPAIANRQRTSPQHTDEQQTPASLLARADAADIADNSVGHDSIEEHPQTTHCPSATTLPHDHPVGDVNTAVRLAPTAPSTDPSTHTLVASPTATSMLATRHDAQWRRDLQILALHQKMLEKLQQQPQRVAEFLEKLEQRKLHGRIRHGEYLFWYCALSQWQHQAQAIASLLSMEPGPRKYRRRTLLAGLLTETERQQILLGQAL